MIDDLEFLRGEATKLQKVLRNESGKNYKKYATLFQAYLTAKGNLQQLEAYKKQQEEQKRREEENRKAAEEAQKELEAEAKKEIEK